MGGSNQTKTSLGGVWIFSGTTQFIERLTVIQERHILMRTIYLYEWNSVDLIVTLIEGEILSIRQIEAASPFTGLQ